MIVVDGDSHIPVAILEGRDGSALKAWLSKNKQVTTVTCDRASAYAKAVGEILSDCMQMADRFHMLQYLLCSCKSSNISPIVVVISKKVIIYYKKESCGLLLF